MIGTLAAAYADFTAGQWDRAMTTIEEMLGQAHRTGVRGYVANALALRALLLVHRGEHDLARTCTEEVRAEFGDQDQHISPMVDAAAALIALAAADPAGAVAAVSRDRPGGAEPILLHRVRALAHLAAGDVDSAAASAAAIAVDPDDVPYAAAVPEGLRCSIRARTDPAGATGWPSPTTPPWLGSSAPSCWLLRVPPRPSRWRRRRSRSSPGSARDPRRTVLGTCSGSSDGARPRPGRERRSAS